MAHSYTFEELAREILLNVLVQHATYADLHNHVKASPRAYRVFRLNERRVLSTLAWRQFHPAVLSEALALVRLSQNEQPLSREAVLDYCDLDINDVMGVRSVDLCTQDVEALYQLSRNIEFFVKDFSRSILKFLAKFSQCLRSQEPYDIEVLADSRSEKHVEYSDLSDTETGRLQRAFCRFEIYRHLFAPCWSDRDHNDWDCGGNVQPGFNVSRQAALYLGQLPHFQVAEIHCVRDYLIRRLRSICDEIEDEIVEGMTRDTFRSDPHGYGFEWADPYVSPVWLFTQRYKDRQNYYLEYLMSLGLPYIRRVFQATGKSRQSLFIRNFPGSGQPHILSEFLTHTFYFTSGHPAATNNPNVLGTSKSGLPFESTWDAKRPAGFLGMSEGWKWVQSPGYPPYGPRSWPTDKFYRGFRDWGYVFWDEERLEDSGVLDGHPLLGELRRFDEDFANWNPSVQERLEEKYPADVWDEEDVGLALLGV